MATQTRSKTSTRPRESTTRQSRTGSPIDPPVARSPVLTGRYEPSAVDPGGRTSRSSHHSRHSNPPSEAEVTMMVKDKGKDKDPSPPRPSGSFSPRLSYARERLDTLFATFDQKVAAAMNEVEEL